MFALTITPHSRHPITKIKLVFLTAVFFLALTNCQSAYYAFWETLGKDKGDLLRDNIKETRNEQKKVGKEFQDALDTLRATYGSSGSDLEKHYDQLRQEYEEARLESDDLHKRIEKLNRIAEDLFAEWEQEATTIENGSLRARSLVKLQDTRLRYTELYASLKKSEASMAPVLTKLHDNVLYIKHSLNAESLGTLQRESRFIERDIQRLIDQMNRSIAQSDAFLNKLDTP